MKLVCVFKAYNSIFISSNVEILIDPCYINNHIYTVIDIEKYGMFLTCYIYRQNYTIFLALADNSNWYFIINE